MVNFLTQPIFKDIILPFLLVFALVFAILEKTKILGDEKHQINAIVGFVIAGLFIGFFNYVTMLQKFMIFLVVVLVILFVLMLLYGFISGNTSGDVFAGLDKVKYLLGGIVAVALIVAILFITGTWDTTWNFFTSGTMGMNIVFIIIIIAAIVAVYTGSSKNDKGKGKSDT